MIFNREGAGHTIGCRVVVLVDGELWRGGHYGDTLTEALKQSLGHMKAATQKFRPTTQG
ncbi:MAG: hypothetical protein HY075_15065 [Deltaproteobacteria bacterium]|nr:hypothetical protein [Deltaproteobacteria bacterium]